MRYFPILKITGALLLLVCCFASSSVFAHTLPAGEIHGVVQSIDYRGCVKTGGQ
jgi:hypothetical protein